MRLKHFIFGLALLVSSSLTYADSYHVINLPNTGWDGPNQTGGNADGRHNNVVFDGSWRAGFVADGGIGYEDPLNKYGHNGAEPNIHDLIGIYKSGSVLMRSAFIYDNDDWPIGVGTWYPGTSEVSWIGEVPNYYLSTSVPPSEPLASHLKGYYAYAIDFTIDDPAHVGWYTLLGDIKVDNALIGIFIDGDLIFNATLNPWTTGYDFHSSSLFTYDFELGMGSHSLMFLTSNFGNSENYGNPSGFWGQNILLQQVPDPDSVPEPSTLLLFAAGLAGLGWHARQNRRKFDTV